MLKHSDGPNVLSPVANVFAFLYDSKHAAGVVLGVAHARRIIALANDCYDLVLRSKGNFRLLFIMCNVFGHADNAGNALTVLLPWVQQASFLKTASCPACPTDWLFPHPLLSVPQCLSRVAEVLHSLVVEMQLAQFYPVVFSYALSVGPLVPFLLATS